MNKGFTEKLKTDGWELVKKLGLISNIGDIYLTVGIIDLYKLIEKHNSDPNFQTKKIVKETGNFYELYEIIRDSLNMDEELFQE